MSISNMIKLFVVLAVATVVSGNCPSGWVTLFGTAEGHDTCVQAFKNRMDYYSAEQFCNKFDGHLASVHNGFQANHIYTISEEVDTQCQFWIGANRFADTFIWTWMDHSYMNFTRWKAGYPRNDPNSSDCALMETEKSNKWTNDGSCAEFNCFVCTAPKYKPCTPGGNMDNCPTPPAPTTTTDNFYTSFAPMTNTPVPVSTGKPTVMPTTTTTAATTTDNFVWTSTDYPNQETTGPSTIMWTVYTTETIPPEADIV